MNCPVCGRAYEGDPVYDYVANLGAILSPCLYWRVRHLWEGLREYPPMGCEAIEEKHDMSDEEEELQKELDKEPAYLYPRPDDKRRLSASPCIRHGLEPDCGCTSTIEVELDLYHIAVLYPGLIANALDSYFEDHKE